LLGIRVLFVKFSGLWDGCENKTWIHVHRTSGGGLGLHTSILAAREMGGDLLAQSDGPGCGAVFTLEIPCEVLPALSGKTLDRYSATDSLLLRSVKAAAS
jgi:hypothetical protein